MTDELIGVLSEIHVERERQDAKWGEQNHPIVPPTLQEFLAKETEIARRECEKRAKEGRCTWYDILLEEFFEAFAEPSPEGQRAEFVQVAAVAVAIIECIDRKREHDGR